jgi:WD40 repeat protein
MDGQLFFEHDFQYKSIQAHDSLIRALEHDGQFRLFSGSDDSAIKMWDIRGEQPQLQRVFGSLEGIRSYHRQLNLLEGGRVLASSRGQFDAYRIRLWDLASFANVRTLQGHEGYIRSMLVDGRGRIVSASEDRTVKVWSGRSCELVCAYFHGSKILFLFAHAPTHSYCIIDDKNRALLLDQDALAVYHALYIGRKVVYAAASSFLYLHVDRYLLVYSWTLDLEERLDLGSTWASTNIIEMGTALLITDVHGNLHELHPAVLARN